MVKTWTIQQTVDEALSLEKGKLTANFGIRVQVSVEPDVVIEAVSVLKNQSWNGTAGTQACILVEAQKLGGLQSHAPLSVG